MRHRNLVFAAFLVLFAAFTTHAQEIEFDVVGHATEVNDVLRGGRKADTTTPQVTGRVTDFVGRSVKAAEITFFCLDSDEVASVRTNAFGYYQISSLTDGHSYLLSIQHKKYLFLIAPDAFTVGPETLEFNFLGELAR